MAVVHERIRSRRKELGISVDDVADALGVSRATIYRYEAGEIVKIPYETLYAFARVLKTSSDYLMGRTSDVNAAERQVKMFYDPRPIAEAEKERKASGPVLDFIAISSEENQLLNAYRSASPDTQKAVRAVLGIAEQGGEQS